MWGGGIMMNFLFRTIFPLIDIANPPMFLVHAVKSEV